MQARAKDIHSSSAAIAKQEADIAKQIDLLAQQTAQYQQIAGDSRGKLKEIGDVQIWAEILEPNFMVLEETITIADENAAQAPNGGGKSEARKRWF